MNERGKITGAPRPITFSDGTTYRVSPLSDRDIAELDHWVQARYVAIARDSLPPNASQQLREETMTIAMNTALGLTWMSGVGARTMGTIDGMTQLIWQSIHKLHPDVTIEELRNKMFDPANVDEVARTFKEVNPVPKMPHEKKGPPPNSRPKSRRRKRTRR